MSIFFQNAKPISHSTPAKPISVKANESFLTGDYRPQWDGSFVCGNSKLLLQKVPDWGEGEFWGLYHGDILFYISSDLEGPWSPVASVHTDSLNITLYRNFCT